MTAPTSRRLSWLLISGLALLTLGCQRSAAAPMPFRGNAEAQPDSVWRLPQDHPAALRLHDVPGAILGAQLHGVFTDLRWATTAWKWTGRDFPVTLEALQNANLLPRVPLTGQGKEMPLRQIEPGATPAQEEFGVILTAEGFEVLALNPNPDTQALRPVFSIKTTYEQEWRQSAPMSPVPIAEARTRHRQRVAEWQSTGQPTPSAANLASMAGANELLWTSDQLNERRVINFQQIVWAMIERSAEMHGQLPTSWEALCQELRWAFPELRVLTPGEAVSAGTAAFAAQMYQDGETVRFLLKPTVDAADLVVYRYRFLPEEGRFEREALDDGPDDGPGWTDLIRIGLPTDPDIGSESIEPAIQSQGTTS